ncbi:MAG: hypothetical protein AMXMBFR58_37290 [Phycisphaerae bacterium]
MRQRAGRQAASLAYFWTAVTVFAQPGGLPPSHDLDLHIAATTLRSAGGVQVVSFDASALGLVESWDGPVVVPDFPLPGGESVTLTLEKFTPITRATRFVAATPSGADREVEFDASQILMLRGSVAGAPGSHVFLSLAPRSAVGRIDLGPGRGRYLLSHSGGSGVALNPGEYAVFAASEGGVSLEVPLCGVTPPPGWTPPPEAPPGGGGRENDPVRGLRQLQLAVDTDREYFQIFGNIEDANTYVVQLYGQVSDIFLRDVNTRVDLVFVRLWPDTDDPYTSTDPLDSFRTLWNTTMQSVNRDAAQLLLGSRLLSAGGVAYAPALCNSSSYSWAGYTLGYFSDPDRPHWSSRDIMVTAHELGHNCGTYHTHDYNLDNCDDALSHPQRGTIMSYCGQTYSGGDANHDLWFHEYTVQQMRNYMSTRTCLAADCNQNREPDSQDIQLGVSQDVNANGVPDECEDCNANGVLDAADIASGLSSDVDADGLPDECQADCNSNGVPDRHDIQLQISSDFNANRIPDECEPDIDADGVMDYRQIHTDMTLDVDRDVVLDAFQDCDANGQTDHRELDHAWNLYCATTSSDASVREFFSRTGVLVNVAAAGQLADGQDLVITPSRRVLVSSGLQDRVVELDREGTIVRDLVPAAAGLDSPAGLLVRPEQNTVLVVSRGLASVLEFSLVDGSLVRTVVAPGSGGLSQPFGIAVSGDRLCLTTGDNRVLEYSLQTGAFVRELVAAASGSLADPRGILFKPDGNLLVASRGTNRINEYRGDTGAFVRRWNINGTSTRLTLDEPWCLRIGPDGDVYASRNLVTRGHGGGDDDHDDGDDDHAHDDQDHPYGWPTDLHLTDARIYQFDIDTGAMVRAYVLGSDTGLYRPTGFDFMPGSFTDCNRNLVPDPCDLASGTSADSNSNGLPDECEPACTADFDSSGFVDTDDFDVFVAAFEAGTLDADIDRSGFVDTDDFDAFVHAFEQGC